MEKQIDWSKATIEDYKAAMKICKRASRELGSINVRSLQMDIVATHISGCRLKLAELLKSATGDFLHDVCGIMRHIDRTTGKLTDCFWPRYAA